MNVNTLLESAKISGSRRLGAFGPDLELAREVLKS
jgi:hypothetical protein